MGGMNGEAMILLQQKTRSWKKYLHQKTQDNYRVYCKEEQHEKTNNTIEEGL